MSFSEGDVCARPLSLIADCASMPQPRKNRWSPLSTATTSTGLFAAAMRARRRWLASFGSASISGESSVSPGLAFIVTRYVDGLGIGTRTVKRHDWDTEHGLFFRTRAPCGPCV